jgi:hypothetical protein
LSIVVSVDFVQEGFFVIVGLQHVLVQCESHIHELSLEIVEEGNVLDCDDKCAMIADVLADCVDCDKTTTKEVHGQLTPFRNITNSQLTRTPPPIAVESRILATG